MAKIRFGIIGTGHRGIRTYGGHLRGRYADRAQLVALADTDRTRLKLASRLLEVGRTYETHSQLLADPDVEAVVITSPDYTHAQIAVDAMAAGKHIICEKPVATTIEDANRLLAASSRFDKAFLVGFVLRYAPFFKGMHDAIEEGLIGTPLIAAATDNRAGGGYFRSWHRLRRYSGGLLNHKSGHTLDILNWMLGQTPTAVAGTGGIAVFGPKPWAGRYCSECQVSEICPEYFDISKGWTAELFRNAEARPDSKSDLCVYNSDKDTVDHAAVNVEYSGGALASYTLCLFAPYNQRELAVMGTLGKLEGREGEDRVRLTNRSSYQRRQRMPVGPPSDDQYLRVGQASGGLDVVGGHGGGDLGLLDDCFDALEGKRDPVADLKAGYWSAIIGVMAEESIARNGQRLTLADVGVSPQGGALAARTAAGT